MEEKFLKLEDSQNKNPWVFFYYMVKLLLSLYFIKNRKEKNE